jgi:DNA polymerase-1
MNQSFPKTLQEFYGWFLGRRFEHLAIDVETDGLHYGCKLLGFSLCDGERACYVNLENNPDSEDIIESLHSIQDCTKILIGHNLPFDLRVLKKYGISYWGKVYDTSVAAHLLNESKSCGLKELASRVLKVPKEEILDFEKAVEFGYSSDKFKTYAINDVIWTYRLYEISKPLLERQGLWKLFEEIEMPFVDVLVDLYENGILIDRDKLEDFEDILTAEKHNLENKMLESIGMDWIKTPTLFGFDEIESPIDLNSSKQLADIITNKLKIKLPLTDKGNKSTAEDVLQNLKGEHKFIDLLLRYRKVEKLLNTFILPMADRICSDGRIRAGFNDTGTRSGRLSSSRPNLQNIPKYFGKDDVVNIRELFIPEKGNKFIEFDYDNQELRFLAILTQDPNLVKAFRNNYDLHLYTAVKCLGLPIPEKAIVKTHPDYPDLKIKYEKERHIGKNGINFPIVYGSTPYGIAKNNGVSEETATEWMNGFFKAFPKVKESIDDCKKMVFKSHCVTNYFGRKRRFGEIDNQAYRIAYNHQIQSSAADVLRISMVSIKKLLGSKPEWGAKIVLTVHDSVLVELKEQFAEQAKNEIKVCMENAVKLPLELPVDAKICESYAG